MVRTLLFIGLGGGLGSMARYLISFYFSRNVASAFPYGTFTVNIVGCFLIGVFFGLSERYQWITEEWRIFLTVGFCGGFTTFSAFAIENIRLLQAGNYVNACLYIAGSLILGIAMVFAGIAISKL